MAYIHGTTKKEQDRLTMLNKLLNQRCLDKIKLNGSERALDIGSGLGIFSRMLANQLPKGLVVGIEKSVDQLTASKQKALAAKEIGLVDFRSGGAYRLPLEDSEWGTFDIIFIRFLLEHLGDPNRALQEAYKALRPGGRIYLVDDDHANFHITPLSSGFEALWPPYCQAYIKQGNDPFIGRNLISLLNTAGFNGFAIDFILFGGAQSEVYFLDHANNLMGFLEGARSEIKNVAPLSDDVFNLHLDDIRNWSQKPDACLWYFANWAEAMKPQ